jgi:hypothetical protein
VINAASRVPPRHGNDMGNLTADARNRASTWILRSGLRSGTRSAATWPLSTRGAETLVQIARAGRPTGSADIPLATVSNDAKAAGGG